MENRVKIRVAGISYSPLQNGAFALLLAPEGDSPVRIPVVIGPAEAQSIAVFLESIRSPRPMTHDLFCSFARAYGIVLTDVFIYKFEDGIYSAEMRFDDGEREVVLDSRTSDAIAIAMRTGAAIYTTPEIIDECGIVLEEVSDGTDDMMAARDESPDEDNDEAAEAEDDTDIFGRDDSDDPILDPDLEPELEEVLSDDDLARRLTHFTETEDYERAARTSAIINRRKKQ